MNKVCKDSKSSNDIIHNLFWQGLCPSPKYMTAVGRLGEYSEDTKQVILFLNEGKYIPLTIDPLTPINFRKVSGPDEDENSLSNLGPQTVQELARYGCQGGKNYSKKLPLVIVGGTLYLHQDGSQTFQLNELTTASYKSGCYRWEQPYYWPGHLNQLLETRLAILFDTDSLIDVNDISLLWRTHISAWGEVQGDRIETATLARFAYAAASTALLNDNQKALDASKAACKFQIRELVDKTGDDNIRIWLHAKDRDMDGRPILVKKASGNHDRQHIPLYEQIYDISGLTQTFLVTRNNEILVNIEKTLNSFDIFFKVPDNKGWYSHIDVSTKSPIEDRLGENKGSINWNSVGDHVPAYLFSLLSALGPKHENSNVRINTIRSRAESMLIEAVKLIVHKFPGDDHSTVRERFTVGTDGELKPNLSYGWQQNRAIGGHNFKIIWNLTRAANYFNSQAERAEQQKLISKGQEYRNIANEAGNFADCLNDQMMSLAIDPVNCLVHDGIERSPSIPGELQIPWKPHGDFWQHEQGVNALGEQYGWHMRQGNLVKANEILELWRRLNLVWTGKFLDFENKSVHFRLTDQLEPIAQNTNHIGGVDIAGYHESEYALLQNFMVKAYISKEPLSLNFYLDADRAIEGASNELLSVSGDANIPGIMRITQITINGQYFDIPIEGNTLVPNPEDFIINLEKMGLDANGNPKKTKITVRFQPKSWEDYWQQRSITCRDTQEAKAITANTPDEQMNHGIQLDEVGRPQRMTFWKGVQRLVASVEPDPHLLETRPLNGKKVVIVVGEDYIADELKAYIERFQAYGADVRFTARMWGTKEQTFTSDDAGNSQVVEQILIRNDLSIFADFQSEKVAIVVAPASNSMKNATYSTDKSKPENNDVTKFFLSALHDASVVVAANCHGLYAFTPAKNVLDGFSVTTNGDMAGEVLAAGATIVPDKVVKELNNVFVDRNLVTSMSGVHTNYLIDRAVHTYLEINN